MDDFNEVYRIESRQEEINTMEEFMRDLLPVLDEHKQEQRRTIESGVIRLNIEIVEKMTIDHNLLKQDYFKQAGVMYKKAEDYVSKIKSQIHRQRDTYIKFRETGDNNQSLNGDKKMAKRDTLKCLIRLSVEVAEVFNLLKQLSGVVNQFWDMYKYVGKFTYDSMFCYHKKLSRIMQEYFYLLSENNKKYSFEDIKAVKDNEDLDVLSTLLESKYIKLIKVHTELKGKAAFDETVNRYGFSFNQDFESFIGQS